MGWISTSPHPRGLLQPLRAREEVLRERRRGRHRAASSVPPTRRDPGGPGEQHADRRGAGNKGATSESFSVPNALQSSPNLPTPPPNVQNIPESFERPWQEPERPCFRAPPHRFGPCRPPAAFRTAWRASSRSSRTKCPSGAGWVCSASNVPMQSGRGRLTTENPCWLAEGVKRYMMYCV